MDLPKCEIPLKDLKKPRRIAQFSEGYFKKDHKEHLVRDYFDEVIFLYKYLYIILYN